MGELRGRDLVSHTRNTTMNSREKHHARGDVGLDVIQHVFLAFEASDDDGAGGIGKNGKRTAGHIEDAIEHQQHTDAFRG